MEDQIRSIESVSSGSGENEFEYSFNQKKYKFGLHPEVAKPNTYSFLLLETLELSTTSNALDMGTGTGFLAIIMAGQNNNLRIVASDINQYSVELAKTNAKRNGLDAQIECVKGNLFEPVVNEKFDLIVCDPRQTPVPNKEVDKQPSRLNFYLNTSGGNDGLEFIKDLVLKSPNHLNPNGKIQIVVVDYIGTDRIFQIMEEAGLSPKIDASAKTELSPMTKANRSYIENALHHSFKTNNQGKEYMELLILSGTLIQKSNERGEI